MKPNIDSYSQFSIYFAQRHHSLWHVVFDIAGHQLQAKNKNTAVIKLSQIINSTFKISQTKGFQAMTMRDLSQHSCISMGGLYAYFANKQQIASTIHFFLQSFCRQSFNQINSDENAEQVLFRVIRLHLYLSELLKDWFYFVYMECRHLGKKLKRDVIQSELETEKLLADALKRGCKLGYFNNKLNTVFTARMIKAMLQDWYLKSWKYEQDKTAVEDYAQQLTDLVNQWVHK